MSDAITPVFLLVFPHEESIYTAGQQTGRILLFQVHSLST